MNMTIRVPHNEKWKLRFMEMAALVSVWSKDPSTKVGAVIVSKDRRSISTGYNGFPPGMDDGERWYKDRDHKYPRVIHAEVNAILNATFDVRGAYLYCTHAPCVPCASVMIGSRLAGAFYLHMVPDAGCLDGVASLRSCGIWCEQLTHPELLKSVDSSTRCC